MNRNFINIMYLPNRYENNLKPLDAKMFTNNNDTEVTSHLENLGSTVHRQKPTKNDLHPMH